MRYEIDFILFVFVKMMSDFDFLKFVIKNT